MITPFVMDLSNCLPSIPFFLQQKMNILGFVNCTYLEKFHFSEGFKVKNLKPSIRGAKISLY